MYVADLITALVLMVGTGSAAELVRSTCRKQLRNPAGARRTALTQ
jgi:hypothetical protein